MDDRSQGWSPREYAGSIPVIGSMVTAAGEALSVAGDCQLVPNRHRSDDAPVAQDVDAREVTGSIAGAERQQLRDFLRPPEPFECGVAKHCAGSALLLQPAHRSVDRARGN